ncbi:hypothetical protein D3C83_44390 [compost metagenome]
MPSTPPATPINADSTSTDTTTGNAPKPKARSVAISRARAETAEYIVLTAAKMAPKPISTAITAPTEPTSAVSERDCSS